MLHTFNTFWWVTTCELVTRSNHELPLDVHTWSIPHTLLHTIFTLFPPKYRVSKCWITNKFDTKQSQHIVEKIQPYINYQTYKENKIKTYIQKNIKYNAKQKRKEKINKN